MAGLQCHGATVGVDRRVQKVASIVLERTRNRRMVATCREDQRRPVVHGQRSFVSRPLILHAAGKPRSTSPPMTAQFRQRRFHHIGLRHRQQHLGASCFGGLIVGVVPALPVQDRHTAATLCEAVTLVSAKQRALLMKAPSACHPEAAGLPNGCSMCDNSTASGRCLRHRLDQRVSAIGWTTEAPRH